MFFSYFYKVENKDRYKTANPHYWLAKTKTDTYLFSDADLLRAEERAESNPEDIPAEKMTTPSSLRSLTIGFVTGLVAGISLSAIQFFLR
jgi:hypothetical protein